MKCRNWKSGSKVWFIGFNGYYNWKNESSQSYIDPNEERKLLAKIMPRPYWNPVDEFPSQLKSISYSSTIIRY